LENLGIIFRIKCTNVWTIKTPPGSLGPDPYKLVYRCTYESTIETMIPEERILHAVELFICVKDFDSRIGFRKITHGKKGKPGLEVIDIPLKNIISHVPYRFPLPKGVNSFEEFE